MSTHFVHQRGVACLARWGLREQVVATQSPMATFAPPPPDMLALYTALQGNQAAIDRFIGLITEATSPIDFFAPEHVQRLLAHAPVRPN
jgi:hypothetical protein